MLKIYLVVFTILATVLIVLFQTVPYLSTTIKETFGLSYLNKEMNPNDVRKHWQNQVDEFKKTLARNIDCENSIDLEMMTLLVVSNKPQNKRVFNYKDKEGREVFFLNRSSSNFVRSTSRNAQTSALDQQWSKLPAVVRDAITLKYPNSAVGNTKSAQSPSLSLCHEQFYANLKAVKASKDKIFTRVVLPNEKFRNNEEFDLKILFKNPSNAPSGVELMSCSYSNNISFSPKVLTPIQQACFSNYPSFHFIPPKSQFDLDLKVLVKAKPGVYSVKLKVQGLKLASNFKVIVQ